MQIRKEEVRAAMKRMRSGKVVGPEDLPVKVEMSMKESRALFNQIV